MKKIWLILVLLAALVRVSAAVGCDLNDPDKDVKRLFPGSTGYKTLYRSVSHEGGKALLAKIETQLGDKFSGMYETIDVPYSLYEIYKGKELIGYIHGVNQKGKYGGLQIFMAFDAKGTIKDLYFQKFSTKNIKEYRSPGFTKQFIGLRYQDFSGYNPKTGTGTGKGAAIKDPVPKGGEDFRAIMRGVKKNLVLMEHFATWKN